MSAHASCWSAAQLTETEHAELLTGWAVTSLFSSGRDLAKVEHMLSFAEKRPGLEVTIARGATSGDWLGEYVASQGRSVTACRCLAMSMEHSLVNLAEAPEPDDRCTNQRACPTAGLLPVGRHAYEHMHRGKGPACRQPSLKGKLNFSQNEMSAYFLLPDQGVPLANHGWITISAHMPLARLQDHYVQMTCKAPLHRLT